MKRPSGNLQPSLRKSSRESAFIVTLKLFSLQLQESNTDEFCSREDFARDKDSLLKETSLVSLGKTAIAESPES